MGEARDSTKVVGQVRLLAGILTPTDGSDGRLQPGPRGFDSRRRLLQRTGQNTEASRKSTSHFRLASVFCPLSSLDRQLSCERLAAIVFSSPFCGSANFDSPSAISTSSIFTTSTLASMSASTSAGGSLSTCLSNVLPLS